MHHSHPLDTSTPFRSDFDPDLKQHDEVTVKISPAPDTTIMWGDQPITLNERRITRPPATPATWDAFAAAGETQ